MVTSRTGTTTWKAIRRRALQEARANGHTACPWCKTEMDFGNVRKPNSAEADHIIPHARGGRDTLSNVVIICAACNQSKGNRAAPKQKGVLKRTPVHPSRKW